MKCFKNLMLETWKCFRDVTFKIWNVSETWCSKHEVQYVFQKFNVQTWNTVFIKFYFQNMKMIQKRDIQNIKCFRNVTFKTWNTVFQKIIMFKIWKCFRNVTFKIWNVLETWHSNMKYSISKNNYVQNMKMFQERDIQNMKCSRNLTFKHEIQYFKK